MNSIAGRVVLKESGVGIPDLLVVIHSIDPKAQLAHARAAGAAAATPLPFDRLGSVLTDKNGAFQLNYEDADFAAVGTALKRPGVVIEVLAPEEPGQTDLAQILYSATAARQNAGRTEQFLVRLDTERLKKAGIQPPTGVPQDLEPIANVVGRLSNLATHQTGLVDGHIAAAKQLVDGHRTRHAAFHSDFKPALEASLSTLPANLLDADRHVAAGESVADKSVAAIRNGLRNTVNADDPATRAPARGFLSLTDAEVDELRSAAGPDGVVPATAVAALQKRNGTPATTTYVQAQDRLPLCRPKGAGFDCTQSALDPPPVGDTPPAPGTVPGAGIGPMSAADIPRYLARLVDPMLAPETGLATGLMPVANRESVENSVKSFIFQPSPADVPSFHDFNNLQIAFEYVWQEALDQGIIDLAQNAYETIVELGGDPAHPTHGSAPPLRALNLEANLVLRANATPTVVVRDHRGEPPGTRIAPPPSWAESVTGIFGALANRTDTCGASSTGAVVRDHRTGVRSPTAIADPVQRLPALLAELDRKRLQKYSFTVYAANAKERSVNFGLLNTYRQIWTPLAYQAGPLVKSIPLAPKQTQKIVITRKTTKKRTQKEMENNLRVTKDESSQTNRAEQEIVKKASTNTNFSYSNEAKGEMAVGSDTSTTKFSQDTAKSSDDMKKSFHEAVFKSAQEFKHERSTEIGTEETQEYESVETTEIGNPNDEIAVTFLFYELQRRYRIYERLYRVQPVVLVAQEFPQPNEIDQSWLVKHDWILRRAILDDSFLPILENLVSTAGEEVALAEMQTNVNQQRCIVQQLRQELGIASSQATALRAVLDRSVNHKSGASSGGLLGAIEGLATDVVGGGAIEKVGDWLFGGSSEQNDSNRQSMQERADAAADRVRDLTFRVEREVTALNALTETYAKALREYYLHLTEIARLEVHVKDNIMYYMQAVWTHEPPDQRYFRLHNTPIPTFKHVTHGLRIDFDNVVAGTLASPHKALPRYGGRDAKTYATESVTKFRDELEFKPLSQVADLDRLLGFKGNYMVFPLLESNPLTDFMMDPFVDRATGQLVDPADPLNWSLDEFTAYVCCLKDRLSEDEFAALQPSLRETFEAVLSNSNRNDDVLVVPTNSLFIAALPDTHTLLEQFKLGHRVVDVMSAEADARGKEIENLRRAARLLAGEREDPNVDKRILVQGAAAQVVVPADDN